MNLSAGHVLCPACSGVGVRVLTEMKPKPTCTLCGGYGEVPEAKADEFWACVQEASRRKNAVFSSCVTRRWA